MPDELIVTIPHTENENKGVNEGAEAPTDMEFVKGLGNTLNRRYRMLSVAYIVAVTCGIASMAFTPLPMVFNGITCYPGLAAFGFSAFIAHLCRQNLIMLDQGRQYMKQMKLFNFVNPGQAGAEAENEDGQTGQYL